MNPLVLPEEAYRVVYDRVAQLSLDYLSGLEERCMFSRHIGS